jgi:hypothetical protein
LRDGELAELHLADGEAETPESARQMRLLLAGVGARHPIARHFFVWQGNAVRFPLLRTPPPRPLDAYLARQDPAGGRRFAALFAAAESQELNRQRPDLALTGYHQSYGLPVSAPLKALALARAARCFQKMDRPREAAQAYRALAEEYGDVFDPFSRPYGLIAGLELDDLARIQGQSSASLVDLYRDLVRGRWELSAEQIDYFLSRFGERLKEMPSRPSETEFLSHLEMARALQEGFRHHGPLRAGQVYADAFRRGEANYQTYYTLLPAGREPETLVGFAIKLNWVESQLLPQCRNELGMEESFGLSLKAAQKAGSPASAQETRVAFPTVFPFWEIRVGATSGQAQPSPARREMLVFTGATFLILCVLGLGVFFWVFGNHREAPQYVVYQCAKASYPFRSSQMRRNKLARFFMP